MTVADTAARKKTCYSCSCALELIDSPASSEDKSTSYIHVTYRYVHKAIYINIPHTCEGRWRPCTLYSSFSAVKEINCMIHQAWCRTLEHDRWRVITL